MQVDNIQISGDPDVDGISTEQIEKSIEKLLNLGFSKEQITVEVNDNVLTVKGEIKIENIDDKKRYNRQEFNQSNFERTFTLQDNLDDDKITAKYENGVLILSIPKLEVEEKKKKLMSCFQRQHSIRI